MSFRVYEIHKEKESDHIDALLPETFGKNRGLLPDQTFVLVAYYKSQAHYEWILKTGLYNARAEDKRGSLRLGLNEVGAKYLLLHTAGEVITGNLFRIIEPPRIFSKQNLIAKNYPTEPSQEFYLTYRIEPLSEAEFKGKFWQINSLKEFRAGHSSSLPFSTSLKELMKVLIKTDDQFRTE